MCLSTACKPVDAGACGQGTGVLGSNSAFAEVPVSFWTWSPFLSYLRNKVHKITSGLFTSIIFCEVIIKMSQENNVI